jgi:hypothetical protein
MTSPTREIAAGIIAIGKSAANKKGGKRAALFEALCKMT